MPYVKVWSLAQNDVLGKYLLNIVARMTIYWRSGFLWRPARGVFTMKLIIATTEELARHIAEHFIYVIFNLSEPIL